MKPEHRETTRRDLSVNIQVSKPHHSNSNVLVIRHQLSISVQCTHCTLHLHPCPHQLMHASKSDLQSAHWRENIGSYWCFDRHAKESPHPLLVSYFFPIKTFYRGRVGCFVVFVIFLTHGISKIQLHIYSHPHLSFSGQNFSEAITQI